MDDDFGADDDLLAALAASNTPAPQQPSRITQPRPQRIEKIQQAALQRLDNPPPAVSESGQKIVQPIPQALPGRSSSSSILVSTRQKGNPVLACLKSIAWEYSDIPADYGLGLTTCALFLSLKYHRLHPEYIYTRIRNLQGKYNLRILLTLVDIPNHEDSLRELAKTSLVNDVTVILCWSAAEAARYLELYKSYEHASFAGIKGQQATSYAERLVEFVTVPRVINKADAVALVSTFGSLRNAINGDPELVSIVSGWGEKKVKAWCKVVEEPFRVKKATKRRAQGTSPAMTMLPGAVPTGRVPAGRYDAAASAAAGVTNDGQSAEPSRSPIHSRQISTCDIDMEDDEEAMVAAAIEACKKTAMTDREDASGSRQDDELSAGVAAALAKLRDKG